MLAAIPFGLRAPGFFNVTAFALDRVRHVRPELQVAAAEFALLVFLVAGALPGLLDLHFMVRKLRNILRSRSGYCASRQGHTPRSSGPNAAGFGPTRPL